MNKKDRSQASGNKTHQSSRSWEVSDAEPDSSLGCVLGSAVGDALGAPFEFLSPGAFSERFPWDNSDNEMIGNSLWEPGEFTDDTQMAILETLAFLDAGNLEEALPLAFAKFASWSQSGPKDIGISTSDVLCDPDYRTAASDYFEENPHAAAGNGGLMRASFIAARGSFGSHSDSVEMARKFSALTHGDPSASEGRALWHSLIFAAVRGEEDVFGEPLDWALDELEEEHRELYADMLSPHPPTRLPNGTVWGCMRDAAQALRRSDSFEDCMRIACDSGDDVDTVAAVAGSLAGAVYGVHDIPERWLEALNGEVLGEFYDADALIDLHDKVLAVPRPEN